MGTQAEWDAMSDREKEQFFAFRDAKDNLVLLHRYVRRHSDVSHDDSERIEDYIKRIGENLTEWAGQKWVAEVDLVMETRIDAEPVRLAAAQLSGGRSRWQEGGWAHE